MTTTLFLLAALLFNGAICGSQNQRRRSPPPAPSTPVEFDCPEEFGYYAHPTDCTQYYVCVFGGALLESCTGGLMYSHELQTCDWPRNVGCAPGAVGQVAQVQQPETRTRQSAQQRIQQQQQQPIPKHDLYTEDEQLSPEELDSDRQQRVYRGQPQAIGQVQSDRDALSTHSNAIPVPTGGRDKLSVVSYGTQQQYTSHQERGLDSYNVQPISWSSYQPRILNQRRYPDSSSPQPNLSSTPSYFRHPSGVVYNKFGPSDVRNQANYKRPPEPIPHPPQYHTLPPQYRLVTNQRPYQPTFQPSLRFPNLQMSYTPTHQPVHLQPQTTPRNEKIREQLTKPPTPKPTPRPPKPEGPPRKPSESENEDDEGDEEDEEYEEEDDGGGEDESPENTSGERHRSQESIEQSTSKSSEEYYRPKLTGPPQKHRQKNPFDTRDFDFDKFMSEIRDGGPKTSTPKYRPKFPTTKYMTTVPKKGSHIHKPHTRPTTRRPIESEESDEYYDEYYEDDVPNQSYQEPKPPKIPKRLQNINNEAESEEYDSEYYDEDEDEEIEDDYEERDESEEVRPTSERSPPSKPTRYTTTTKAPLKCRGRKCDSEAKTPTTPKPRSSTRPTPKTVKPPTTHSFPPIQLSPSYAPPTTPAGSVSDKLKPRQNRQRPVHTETALTKNLQDKGQTQRALTRLRASVTPQQTYADQQQTTPSRSYNASRYIQAQYEPAAQYYNIYDDDDLYKEIGDYAQYNSQNNQYRTQQNYKEKKPQIEIVQQEPAQRGSAYAKNKYSSQSDIYQSVTPQEYDSYSIQTNDDIPYRQTQQTKNSGRSEVKENEGSTASPGSVQQPPAQTTMTESTTKTILQARAESLVSSPVTVNTPSPFKLPEPVNLQTRGHFFVREPDVVNITPKPKVREQARGDGRTISIRVPQTAIDSNRYSGEVVRQPAPIRNVDSAEWNGFRPGGEVRSNHQEEARSRPRNRGSNARGPNKYHESSYELEEFTEPADEDRPTSQKPIVIADVEQEQRWFSQEAEKNARAQAQLKANEEARIRQIEDAERQAKDETRLRQIEQDRRRAKEEFERKAREEALRRAAVEEARRKQAREEAEERAEREEAQRRAVVEEAKRQQSRMEAERRAALEKEKARKEALRRAEIEEEERKAALEEARRQAREEAQRRAAMEEEKRKAALEEARRLAREEAQRRAAIEEEERRAAVEEARKQAREEAQRRAAIEEAKKAREEAERKAAIVAAKKAREEADRRAREEAQRRAAIEEAQRRAAAEEAEKRAAVEEARRRTAAEEARRRAAAEEAQRRAAVEEAQRRAAVEEAQRRAAVEVAQKRSREEAQKKAREESQRRANTEDIPRRVQESSRSPQNFRIVVDRTERPFDTRPPKKYVSRNSTLINELYLSEQVTSYPDRTNPPTQTNTETLKTLNTPPGPKSDQETEKPLRVRPTSYDTQSTPGLTRGNSRHRGSHTYTVAPNEEESVPVNRGTPAAPRARPTLKPSTTVIAKASEYVDIYRYPPHRPENIYPTPQVDKTAAKCRKDVCLLPDCSCGGKDIPGELPLEDTPQIVLLTFDDSVNDLNKGLYADLFEKGRVNPNGCPISATFYVSHEWTDYSQVQNLYAGGHEIASHSVSHSFGEQFSQKKWTREIAGQREILSAYGGVRMEDIRGMRAPFLAVGGNKMFKMLYDSNFTYDSSMPVYENRPPSWPYTMDYKIFHDCMIPPCPTRSYPGVWEVPMVMWQDLNGGRCSMGDACSNPPNSEGVYKMLIKNFERHFTTNRAPFGLFYHAAWFTQPHHKEGFIAFLDTINKMPEVWLVTNWQAVQWVRDPTPINRLNNFTPFQCNYPERPKKCNNPKVCNLWHKSGVRYMRTCQPCPEVYPWTGKSGVRNSRVDNEIINE